MAKKLLSGNGWSFEPSGSGSEPVEESLPDNRQIVRIVLEKRARGKEVTAVSGFVLTAAARKKLAADLKKHCGSGGTTTETGVEIQGDHRDKVSGFVVARGWRVR